MKYVKRKFLKPAFLWPCLVSIAVGVWALFALRSNILSYQEFRSLRITDRNGSVLRTVLSGREGTSVWIPLEDIPLHMINATLVAEDKRFYLHPGIDPIAIARAIRQNIRSKRIVTGGSTLTQQLIRIIRNYPRTLPFKILEALEAVMLEVVTYKKQILAHYFNRAPYGRQCFGIGAAARLFFDKPAAHLTLAESAFLAGLPQSPSRYDPYRHFDKARSRQKRILKQLLKAGLIGPAEYSRAVEEPLALVPGERQFQAPHFCDWVLSGLSPRDKGLSLVETSLDLPLQKDLEDLTAAYVKGLQKEMPAGGWSASGGVTNAAVVVMHNRSREILAMVGSVDYFNEEIDGQVNGALAPRPPGSTWKPITYGLALEQGIPVSEVIPDIPLHAVTSGGDFTPRNFDGEFHGPVRLRTALACSYNIPAVRILERVGLDVLLSRLRRLGFSYLTKPAPHYGLGLTLGGAEASLLQLVRAYAVLANQGMSVNEKAILSPGTNSPEPPADTVFSPSVAYLITDILSDKDARAPAFGAYSPLSFPFPCAAKTGTSKNFRDSWTIGYTKDYTVGVWLGNFDGSPMKSITGASGAAPLFRNIVFRLHRNSWPGDFEEPGRLERMAVCPRSGLKPSKDCPSVIYERFLPGTAPTKVCDVHHMIELDARNGFLAGEGCNPAVIRRELFEVYPPIYRLWCIKHNIPAPPTVFSPLCAEPHPTPPRGRDVQSRERGRGSPATAQTHGPELAVAYPDPGDVFVIDPVLRREYQTLLLTPEVSHLAEAVEWIVDGKLFAVVKYPYTARWPLSEGKHKFRVRTKIGKKWKESPPVSITVL